MVPDKIKIYSVENTPRLRYIAGIVLSDILGLQWEIITDKRKKGSFPVINYSNDDIIGSLKIIPAQILFEKGISIKNIHVSYNNGLPVFFQSPGSDINFDVFAASFFLVTRYEEYLDFEPDDHGRFPASSSFSFKNGFLDKPVIDLWAKELARALLKKIPTLVFRKNVFSALVTLDADEAFFVNGKNIFKSIEEIFHSKTSSHRNTPLKDPYNVFDYILGEIEKSGSESKFFFPVGDHSEFDKNPSWKNEEYRKLILKIAGNHSVGIHPSYSAGKEGSLVQSETKRIRSFLNTGTNLSRFHYLRLSMPVSYRNIISAGISEDYSMGYPDEPGFRAGIARPYFFYDLHEEKQTNLKITPFQIMDETLTEIKKLEPSEAKSLIINMINETKKVGGLFVSIWHNTSLLENETGLQWRDVFETMLEAQKL